MNIHNLIVTIVTGLAVVAGLITYALLGYLPAPLRFTSTLAVTLFIFHSGAATLFLMGLGNFKQRPKTAYRIIALSVVLLALSQLQLLFSSLFNLWTVAWFQLGGLLLPYILSGLFMYLGVRKFTRLLGLQGKLLSLWWVLGGSFVLIMLSAFLPHVPLEPGVTNAGFMLAIAATMWDLVMFSVVLALLMRMKKIISPAYTKATAWLVIGTVSAVLGIGVYLFAQLALPLDHWYREYRLTMISVLVSGIAYLLSARAFNRIYIDQVELSPSGARTFFGKPKLGGRPETRPIISAIIYVAQLAANQQTIEPLLDPLRTITAKGKTALTPTDEQALAKVYLDLEQYLVETEAVHNFTKADLRQRVLARVPKDSKFASTLGADKDDSEQTI